MCIIILLDKLTYCMPSMLLQKEPKELYNIMEQNYGKLYIMLSTLTVQYALSNATWTFVLIFCSLFTIYFLKIFFTLQNIY